MKQKTRESMSFDELMKDVGLKELVITTDCKIKFTTLDGVSKVVDEKAVPSRIMYILLRPEASRRCY